MGDNLHSRFFISDFVIDLKLSYNTCVVVFEKSLNLEIVLFLADSALQMQNNARELPHSLQSLGISLSKPLSPSYYKKMVELLLRWLLMVLRSDAR